MTDTDPTLKRWSMALALLALVTFVLNTVQMVLVWGHPGMSVDLIHDGEPWSMDWTDIPLRLQIPVFIIVVLPWSAWMYAIWQIIRLGLNCMRGEVFSDANTRHFQRVGLGLVAMGLLEMAITPQVAYLFYWTGLTPWVSDFGGLFAIELDYLMAGLLFYVIGRIMQRGLELDSADRFTI